LDLDLLKRGELRSTGNVNKLSFGVVLRAILGWTFVKWCEGFGRDRLEDLISTPVANIGINRYCWLYVRNACSDTSYSNEIPEMLTTHSTDCKRFTVSVAGWRYRLEAQIVAAQKLGRKYSRGNMKFAFSALRDRHFCHVCALTALLVKDVKDVGFKVCVF